MSDSAFVGSIPEIYESLLVPLVFAEPARHLAAAVLAAEPGEILETAAGTGVLTRALVAGGAPSITATDLNQAMLNAAAATCSSVAVRWQVADALELPMPDQAFAAVVCQFGVMFFPDKSRGYAEALRVLRPDGAFFFTVWDRIEANPVWNIVSDALNAASPVAVQFLRRTPYSYFEPDLIRQDLQAGGFELITVDRIGGSSESTAVDAARAVCEGTPLRTELEQHPTLSLKDATAIAADALRTEFGDGTFRAPTSWLQVCARQSHPG
jgi:SAM-dependent methyltransferase